MKCPIKKIVLISALLATPQLLASIPNASKVKSAKQNLRSVVFNTNYSLEARWDAYHKIVTKDKSQSIPLARKAVKSKDWFLREAGLKTFVALKPKEAKTIARNMLKKDPSMLVRAQALSAIKILKDKESGALLWSSLKDPKNFRGDQSLWIRPKIVATLMEFSLGSREQYKNLLDDKDPQVQRLAREALKKYN